MTLASSWAYVFDMSAPVSGHVYDGIKDTSPSDIDYQTDMSSISVHWEGFHDPHTVIKNFFVHIGTCSGCSNVMEQQYIGAHSGILYNILILSFIKRFIKDSDILFYVDMMYKL